MPYIKEETRDFMDNCIEHLIADIVSQSDSETIEGNLNYTITKLLKALPATDNNGEWRYRHINRAIGVLNCVEAEFYRRLGGIYENEAIKNNGDIDIYENYPVN